MKSLFESVSRLSFSFVGNALLTGIGLAVAACGIGLTALYLIEHVDETPAMKTLQCWVGVPRPDCPRHGEKMERLRAELESIINQRDQIEGQLAGLRAIETGVNEITLFEHHTDPNSGLKVTVGTVYRQFVNDQPSPEAYFCYVNLRDGKAGESRNLYIQTRSGAVSVPASTLREVGVDTQTLEFGRTICKPYLIGRG